MTKNNERVTFRLPASLKSSLDRMPVDNSEFLRDITERELDRRQLMKDDQKKKAPAKIERIKELTSEINQLDEQVDQARGRFKEAKKTLDNLESERNKKQSLKQKIVEEIEDETDMDKPMIQGLTGEL